MEKIPSAKFPTEFGEFRIYSFSDDLIVLSLGEVFEKKELLVRVHSQCFTGDVFQSKRCDCHLQLFSSLEMISLENSGMLIYLRNHEGRGIGLKNKIKAYSLQDEGLDTIEANHQLGFPTDAREYDQIKAVFEYFKITSIQLITNNPDKIAKIKKNGISITQRIPLIIKPNEFNSKYLKDKKEKMGHLL
ncbi:MAG: GTP cyclohydrolase II [Candidatus Micrarchaeia archaeon]